MNIRKHSPWATKYINVFGSLESLAERISWSTGLSNMFEWITWNTGIVLGITKTQYANQIIAWTEEEPVRGGTREAKMEYVRQKLEQELKRSEQSERYARPASRIASWREVLRRAKFFSEDYLNKEFDIFWTLASDKYLDSFYGQFTRIKGGGQWSAHGNSGLFQANTGILEMQMDTLSYNETEALLIANELKLGGRKNPDQILKYALMFKLLREKKFIVPQTRFLLLFISGAKEAPQWEALIEEELGYCKNSPKSTARAACQPEVIAIAKSAEYASTSWSELIRFNEEYRPKLDKTQQVEDKLLWGFNESLKAKEFMQRASLNDAAKIRRA
jgi:hypothetical protein